MDAEAGEKSAITPITPLVIRAAALATVSPVMGRVQNDYLAETV